MVFCRSYFVCFLMQKMSLLVKDHEGYMAVIYSVFGQLNYKVSS